MKVGVFDSGMGGLSILKAMVGAAPQYDYLYLGDNARSPYGHRSFESILAFTEQAVTFLFNNNCQIIIIACNTASAKALRTIQQNTLPARHPGKRVLGVIRPAAETVGVLSTTKTIGIWATRGTVLSGSYSLEVKRFSPECRVIQHACPMFVPLIENGEAGSECCRIFIRQYWKATMAQSPDIDVLLLACTHYPIIADHIAAVVPENIRVIEQGGLVAPKWRDYLQRHPEQEKNLSKNRTREFLTTDQADYFNRLAELFLGQRVEARKIRL